VPDGDRAAQEGTYSAPVRAIGLDWAIWPRSDAFVIPPNLPRRLFAEFLGTGLFVSIMVGAGTAAQQLTPNNPGLQLLLIGTAFGLGLGVLIVMVGPVSGAHLNPAVSLADWFLGRRARTGLTLVELGGYVLAQCVGGILGALLANAMFGTGQHISAAHRASGGHLLAEVVATAGLVTVAFATARSGRGYLAAPAVGGYLAVAVWFTSSTAFANPAVSVGRMFTSAITGIAPASVPGFVLMQVIGAAVAVGILLILYPDVAGAAGNVVITHATDDEQTTPAGGDTAGGDTVSGETLPAR
jgi:glycerol uptake facilitator-like aquaporin